MMARSTKRSNQRPDTLMQDRISPNSNKSSCNARPDHTFGSKAEKLDLSIRCPLCPRERTLSDTTGMSALCQKRTYAPQQKHRYSITWSARASSAAERPCRAYQLRLHSRHEIDVGQFLDRKRRVIPIRGAPADRPSV